MKLVNFRRALGLTAASAAMLVMSNVAMAGSTDTTFQSFSDTVTNWATGPLGVGLSVLMMLVGAGMGVARNSPFPALSGIAGAAILHWGPDIINDIMSTGALI